MAATRKKWVAPGLILQIRKRPEDEDIADSGDVVRVGFTVSKKVGNAVKRNRARRRLRAAAQDVIPSHACKGYDFVVIGRAVTLSRPFSSLIRDFHQALKKLGAYRKADVLE